MKEFYAEKLIDKQMKLGEGPVWNQKDNKLYFVDIEDMKIYKFSPLNNELSHINLDRKVSCIVPAGNGNILAGVTDKLILISTVTGKQKIIKNFNFPDYIRFNDGKCDKNGRLLIGTMSDDQSLPEAYTCGSLYSYEINKTATKLLCEMSIPNGIAFSPDNKLLYHIDTTTQTIMAYPYNIKKGIIDKGYPVITFPYEYGSPDGMCIDENNNLWVAMWGGSKVLCIDTQKNKIIGTVHVDAEYVSCCTFGGQNMNELFITTAMNKNSEGGQIFHLNLDIKGTVPFKFNMGEYYEY